MLKKLLATTAVLVFVTAVNADIATSLVYVDNGIAGVDTYDLVVTVSDTAGVGADDWTTAAMEATVTGGTFINNDTFNPPIMPTGDTVYDSFFTSPQWFPNTAGVGFIQYPATPPVETATLRSGEWFDTADTGNGDFVINRLSVTEGYFLVVDGVVSAANTGGTLYPYHFEVPEPASLSLLALGALALIRRR